MGLWSSSGMEQEGTPQRVIHPRYRNKLYSDTLRSPRSAVWGTPVEQTGAIYAGQGFELSTAAENDPRLDREFGAFLDPTVRMMHMHVLGNTGSGKSVFLKHMIRQDILAGHGVCVIDPHGELVEDTLRFCYMQGRQIPQLKERLLVMDATRFPDYVLGYNPLAYPIGSSDVHASVLTDACLTAWNITDASLTPRMQRLLDVVFTLLLEHELPLGDALRILSLRPRAHFREELLAVIEDEFLKDQLGIIHGMNKPADILNQVESTFTRLYKFLRNRFINATFHAPHSINLGQVMERGQILLCNLGLKRANVYTQEAKLLVGFLQAHLLAHILQRSEKSRPFYVYIDEFANFMSRALVDSLGQTRKYGVGYVVAHQNLSQLKTADEAMYATIINSTRTKVVLGGLSREDSLFMVDELWGNYYDPKLVKYVQKTLSQFSKTPELRVLNNWSSGSSESKSTSHSRSESSGESYGTTQGWGQGEALAPAPDYEMIGDYDRYQRMLSSQRPSTSSNQSESQNNSLSVSHSQETGQSLTVGKTEQTGAAESYFVDTYLQEQETSRQFFSLDEQKQMGASTLGQIETGEAIVRVGNTMPFLLRVPYEPLPKSMDDADWEPRVKILLERVHQTHPAFHKQDGPGWRKYGDKRAAVVPEPEKPMTAQEMAAHFWADLELGSMRDIPAGQVKKVALPRKKNNKSSGL